MSKATQTQYGFKYGACEVQRLCSHGGHVMMELKTDRASLHIRVTPSGMFRVEQIDGSTAAVKMANQSHETITIPEVYNDRPIPEIGETHS